MFYATHVNFNGRYASSENSMNNFLCVFLFFAAALCRCCLRYGVFYLHISIRMAASYIILFYISFWTFLFLQVGRRGDIIYVSCNIHVMLWVILFTVVYLVSAYNIAILSISFF